MESVKFIVKVVCMWPYHPQLNILKQVVVTYIPAVLAPATGIKAVMQAVKSEMIKRSRRPFVLLKSRLRWDFDSTHTPPTHS
jgi:hypothetical protein